jgi:hypothetical protein
MAMPISENALETLETWLDGELSESRIEELRRQLSVDPELAQLLSRVRADRQMRSQLFQTLEPRDQEVEDLIADVRRAVRVEEVWAKRARSLKQLTSIAALIALVFMAGWVSHERVKIGTSTPASVAVADQVATQPKAGNPQGNVQMVSAQQPQDGQIQFAAPRGGIELRNLAPSQASSDANQGYRLTLIDPAGKVLAVKRLDILGDPQQFVDQFPHFQVGIRAVPQAMPQSRQPQPTMVSSPSR